MLMLVAVVGLLLLRGWATARGRWCRKKEKIDRDYGVENA
jgi:hypothetical protein